jgi:hypothetical protein
MILLLFSLIVAFVFAQNPLSITLNADASYSLNTPIISLISGTTGVLINGTWYTNGNGLTPQTPVAFSGRNSLGDFTATRILWTVGGTDVLETIYLTYLNAPIVIFEQVIVSNIVTGSKGVSASQSLTTVFPSFQLPSSSNLGFTQYSGAFSGNRGASLPIFGAFNSNAKFSNGIDAGPVILFNSTANGALVMTPSSSFMSGSMIKNGSEFQFGVFGSAVNIPSPFTFQTMFCFAESVNFAMMTCGQALLDKFSKSRDGLRADYTNTHLTYNTDHGAYYYYNPESGKDYLQTLLDVYDYSVQQNIPYKALLLDSWWYYKGTGDGVKNWTAMPSIFAGGNAGIREIVATTGWKIVAHNRYWSNNTDYANGYSFYVDAVNSPAGGQMAVPLETRFWLDLLRNSTKEWGLTTYLQDWLFNLLYGVDLLLTDVNAGRTWLLQMNAGAAASGLYIQYCMSFPRHILQSVEASQVTQSRASDDHVPGMNYYNDQWRIGFSSLFTWSVAIAPSKDNFWSTSSQPGSSCGNSVELSPSLHAAISVFSAGPVSPGDGVGFSDPALIMRTCDMGGRLLQPSRAATALDDVFAQFALGVGANGDIYATYTRVSAWAWDHIIAADVNATYSLTPSSLLGHRADMALIGTSPSNRQAAYKTPAEIDADFRAAAPDLGTVAYSINPVTFDPASIVVQPFSASSPVVIKTCAQVDFQIWHTAPVGQSNIAFLGELGKFIPVSEARMRDVASTSEGIDVLLSGVSGEVITVYFYDNAAAALKPVTCTVGPSGTVLAVAPAYNCFNLD